MDHKPYIEYAESTGPEFYQVVSGMTGALLFETSEEAEAMQFISDNWGEPEGGEFYR